MDEEKGQKFLSSPISEEEHWVNELDSQLS
jgi:hypothetical protein